MSTKTNIPTQTIECACADCATYAQREGLTLPLEAEVGTLMLGSKPTKATRHNLVKIAHQPPFGKPGAHGPWPIREMSANSPWSCEVEEAHVWTLAGAVVDGMAPMECTACGQVAEATFRIYDGNGNEIEP